MGNIERLKWLEDRKQGIGGSDAAAIMGLNPYMSNVDLWEIKTGRKEQEDISAKVCVVYGVKAEQHLRELFKLDNPYLSVSHQEYKTYTHPEYSFVKGSFDGILTHNETGTKGVLEIKTTTIRRQRDWEKWQNRIPTNYFCQLLHYFLCRDDFKFAVLKAKIIEPAYNAQSFYEENKITIKNYFLLRENFQADIELLLEREKEFWGYVERDERPPLLLPEL